MPKMKPFLNYQDQIKNLIAKKGLNISSPSLAITKLQDIRYYALIDGYKSIFYDYTNIERKGNYGDTNKHKNITIR